MTFPPGGPAPNPAKPAATQELDKLLHMAAAGLSVLVLVAGFFPFGPAVSTYASGLGWIPALYLLAGGLSAQVLLPKPAKPGVLPGLVAAAVTLPLLFTVFTGTTAWGAYLLLVLGVLTAAAAVGGFLVESGLIAAPAPRPFQPQPGQWSPQTGGFPQPQPGQPGGPFGQPGPGYNQATQVVPQPGQQPGGQFGAPQQQQPPLAPPTQFMSHPGQFSQPAPPQQQPGNTPPSGFTAPPQG